MYTLYVELLATAQIDKEKKHAVTELLEESKADAKYFFLLGIATVVSSLGIALDSEAVVIGGMLLAPFLAPIMALGYAIVTFSFQGFLRSLNSVLLSFIIVILFSALIGILLNINYIPAGQVLARGEFTILYFLVAFVSGIGASYMWIVPKLSSSLAGISVAVSLIPPLCLSGISIANFNNELAFEGILIFSANIIGILVASMIVFVVTRLTKFKKVEEKLLKEEEKEIESIL